MDQQKALPPGVDFSMQEAMSAAQLQHLLRQDFTGEVLANANVVAAKPLMPWMLTISGAFNLYGEIQYYETELDIRMIESADDFLTLVAQLNKAFDEVAEKVKKG